MAKRAYKITKRISPRDVIGKIDVPAEGETVQLFDVMGYVTGTESGESTYGPWTGLKGEFVAIRLSDDAGFRAGRCFVPDAALNIVVAAWDGRPADLTALEVGFRIGVTKAPKRAENEPEKYLYVCEMLQEPADNDPLELLATKMRQRVLAAPAEDTSKPEAGKKK